MVVQHIESPVASFTKEVKLRLAKRPLIFIGRLANCGLTSLVKESFASHRGLLLVPHQYPEKFSQYIVVFYDLLPVQQELYLTWNW